MKLKGRGEIVKLGKRENYKAIRRINNFRHAQPNYFYYFLIV